MFSMMTSTDKRFKHLNTSFDRKEDEVKMGGETCSGDGETKLLGRKPLEAFIPSSRREASLNTTNARSSRCSCGFVCRSVR